MHGLVLCLKLKGIIELINVKIFAIHNMSDLLKAYPINDVVEVDGCAFLGGYGVVKKEVLDIVANITSNNQTKTNHTNILTQFHS